MLEILCKPSVNQYPALLTARYIPTRLCGALGRDRQMMGKKLVLSWIPRILELPFNMTVQRLELHVYLEPCGL